MKKIKNFKINLRFREIIRLLKSTAAISEVTPQIEDAVRQEIARLSPEIVPAAVYDTLAKDKLSPELLKLLPAQAVAASVYTVTINKTLEDDVNEAQNRGEKILNQILHSLALEAIEQASNFIQRLISDEAKSETCELAGRCVFDSSMGFGNIFAVLPGEKIGVQVTEKGTLSPLYSSCGIIPWLPVKKR